MVEWKKLGEVCDILNGFAFKSQEYVSEGIRIIRISDVQSGCISDKDKVFYPVEKVSEFERYLLHQGDLVMSLTGNPGRIAIIKDDSCALNQRVACLRANDVSRSFLFYLFNCKEFESIAFANSTGGAQKNLSTAWLNNYRIPIPSLSEQQRIVSILDTFTSSISNLKQQIEERRKQYEYERDLLLDLEGKEGVEWKRLSEICEIKGEYGLSVPSKPFDGVRYIRITDITDDGKLNSDCVSADYNEITKVPLEEGDLLFARTGATVGKTLMYLKEYGKCLYAGYLIRYRVNREVVLPKYVFHFTHSNKYNLWVKSNLVEGAQPNINAQKYNSLEIPIPSLQAQSRIVSILDTFEQSISNLEEQLAMREKQYEYYRNLLLTFEGEEERGKT